MRIATWNINGLGARYDFLVHWLRERQPDIVGLQELKLPQEDFPFASLRQEGYHAAALGQKSWNGVAILSREPLEVTQEGLPGQEDLGARLLSARVGGLSFTTVYCPNGKSLEHDDYAGKLSWFESLTDHFNNTHDPAEPTVLCGDFNIVPAPIDSWNEARLTGKLFHSEAERQRLAALTAWGFSDLYRTLEPDTQFFSWWDYRGGSFHRNQGLRIDLVLGSQDIRDRARHAETDREYRKKKDGLTASDHAPVIVDLD